MTRPLLVAVALVLSLFSLRVGAVTLEALPGSAPQSARLFTFYQQPIGVIVRDDAGLPIPGIVIYFTFQATGTEFPAVMFTDGSDGIVTTNADGVAKVTKVVAEGIPGDVNLMASIPGVAPLVFPLKVLPGPATTMLTVGGDIQIASVGQLLAQPWSVRALDDQGLPVPYALVSFLAGEFDDNGFVTFDGADYVSVMADASGLATSPRPRAGNLVGRGVGHVCGQTGVCQQFFFDIIDWPPPSAALLVSAPPLSIELGTTAITPFVVRVLDQAGNGLAGVPVTFTTSEECGRFGSASRVKVNSGINGLATSPLYDGTAEGTCEAYAEIGGLPFWQSIPFNMQVFRAVDVRIDGPSYIVTKAGRPFQMDISFTAAANPIYGLPVSIQVFSGTNGASASIAHAPIGAFDSNVATLKFNANSKAGFYAIAVTRGPIRTYVVVDQRKH